MDVKVPVFYDCEASSLEGYPIEIGWAFASINTGTVISESHLIRPPADWPVEESWDPAAERLHRIPFAQLCSSGRPVWEVARHMNAMLEDTELFSDSVSDEVWLRLLFDAAGREPAFTVRRTDARLLISRFAADRGMDKHAFARAKIFAGNLAPHRHRAEADARHLATLWNIVLHATTAA